MLSKKTFEKLKNYKLKFDQEEIDSSNLENKLNIDVELIVIKETEKNYHFGIETSPEPYDTKHL